jgi:transposase-like protein
LLTAGAADYPRAVAYLRDDLDELLTFWRYKSLAQRKAVRNINAVERRFCEVRRRTRPIGVFSDRTSMDRILFCSRSSITKSETRASAPLSC